MARQELDRAVSTWSLHRTLGAYAGPDSAVQGGAFLTPPAIPPARTLLELIPDIAAHHYRTLHICHFHLESRDPVYLDRVRTALADHGIVLDMLLIDDGDLTAPDIERQLAWYDRWLETAEILGAKRARICAGRSTPTPQRLGTSGRQLSDLAEKHPGVRIVTENWLELTPDADSLLTVLDTAGPQVGLLIDLGNWSGSRKYNELQKIAPRAESCHAKCSFDESGPDETDFVEALSILKTSGFTGPIALIYDGPDPDEWSGLDREWTIVERVFDADPA